MKTSFLRGRGLVACLAFGLGAGPFQVAPAAAAPADAAPAAGPSCGLNTGQPATGAPIALGALVSRTGPDDFSSSAYAAEAYIKCINANGGIHGRPIAYAVEDDRWDPDVARRQATKLVSDQKVIGMVASTSFVECATNSKLYEDQNVIVVAGTGVPRECFMQKNFASLNQGPRIAQIIAAEYAHDKLGARKMVCISSNLPGMGDWVCGGMTEWGKQNGVAVRTVLLDPGSSDATSVMLDAASSTPDAIVIGVPRGILIGLLAAAEQQDLAAHIKFLNVATGYNKDVPGAIGAYWNDRLWISLELRPTDAAGPDTSNWRAVMDRYADKQAPRDSFSESGYLAARIVTQALLRLDPAKIDRVALTNAIRTLDPFTSDMLCGPWYFGASLSRHNANHAGPIALVKDGKFDIVSGCIEAQDPELESIRTYERTLKTN